MRLLTTHIAGHGASHSCPEYGQVKTHRSHFARDVQEISWMEVAIVAMGMNLEVEANQQKPDITHLHEQRRKVDFCYGPSSSALE